MIFQLDRISHHMWVFFGKCGFTAHVVWVTRKTSLEIGHIRVFEIRLSEFLS
jgi:hypothetical protein